jgi:hypothetical protein
MREKSSRTFAQSGLCDAQTHRAVRVRIAGIDGGAWSSRLRATRSQAHRIDVHGRIGTIAASRANARAQESCM